MPTEHASEICATAYLCALVLSFFINYIVVVAPVCSFAVVTSGNRSSATVRHARRMSSLVLHRQRRAAASSVAPPISQQATPASLSSPPTRQCTALTSLSLPSPTNNLPPVSSITVSLPRSFASELAIALHGSVTSLVRDDREAVMREDDSASTRAGLYH